MVNFRLTWTKDGRQYTSAVSYDEASAAAAKARREAEGATAVEIVRVKPGE
ncbi:hypothetical protein ACPB9J_31525 [Streptomyces lavendulocolor]|uniref:hypothetical protein n=1 Tax=Streptomyces lavendulocolor TaxID=67316 RepID=UPI003C2D6657